MNTRIKIVKICIGIVLATFFFYIVNDRQCHKCTNATTTQCDNWKLAMAPSSDGASSSNKVTVVTVNNDGIVKTTAYNKFIIAQGREYAIVSTNMVLIGNVMWREITQQWYEPCACPDGIVGCAVLHARLMEEKKYEIVEIVDENKQKGAQYDE